MMLKPFVTVSVLTAATLTTWFLDNGISHAQSRYSPPSRYAAPKAFACNVRTVSAERAGGKKAVPTTLAQTDRGDVTIYSWGQSFYSDSAETPLARCTRVARILDDLNRKNLLSAIKAGEMKGKKVICVADNANGPCTRLVFPLRSSEDPQAVLADLREALKGKPLQGMPSRRSGGTR